MDDGGIILGADGGVVGNADDADILSHSDGGALGPASNGSGGSNKVPSLRLRVFQGSAKEYDDWRSEIVTTALVYDVRDAQMAGLVYFALPPGAAKPRNLLRHMQVRAEICNPDGSGLAAILKLLDKEYGKRTYVRADEALSDYERCRLEPYATMAAYVRSMRLARRVVERDDPGSTISDVSFARRLMRRSGSSRVEQRSVLAAAGAVWKSEPVMEAMLLMYGDAHHEDKRRAAESRKHRSFGSRGRFSKGGGKGRGKHGKKGGKGTFFEYDDDHSDDESDDDKVATAGADDEEEELTLIAEDQDDDDKIQADEDSEDIEDLMEAYYQGMREKQKLQRLGGNSSSSSSSNRSSSSSSCSNGGKGQGARSIDVRKERFICKDCGKKGHWPGDAECDRAKEGTAKPVKKRTSFAVVVMDSGKRSNMPEAKV